MVAKAKKNLFIYCNLKTHWLEPVGWVLYYDINDLFGHHNDLFGRLTLQPFLNHLISQSLGFDFLLAQMDRQGQFNPDFAIDGNRVFMYILYQIRRVECWIGGFYY